uniref:C-type lectin domain-containing protein n=1 Tax=Oryzias latipes TaxID=8090 RepID=A0A3P9LFI8_ORYLA
MSVRLTKTVGKVRGYNAGIQGSIPRGDKQWYWVNYQINGNTDEDCTEIKYYENENSWNDAECTSANFWMCEKKTGVKTNASVL